MPPTKSTTPCDRFDTCPHESAIIELRASVNAMRDDQAEMKDDIKAVRVAIAGDLQGKQTGLAEQTRQHDRRLGDLEETDQTRRNWAKAAIGTFAATWIGIIATWAWVKMTGKG